MTEYLLNIRYNIINFINIMFWIEIVSWMLIVFIVVVFLLILLWFVVSRLWKKKINITQKLVYQYDNIFYLLSLSQYKNDLNNLNNVEIYNNTWDKWLSLIKSIFNLKNPNYIQNWDLILSGVKKIETLLWEKILGDEINSIINNLNKKLKSISLFYKILQILLILTVLWLLSMFGCVFFL